MTSPGEAFRHTRTFLIMREGSDPAGEDGPVVETQSEDMHSWISFAIHSAQGVAPNVNQRTTR